MTLGFESPLNLIFARLFAQTGTAAAAWSGMWYGLAIGAVDAATRSTARPAAPPPEADEAAAVPPVALVRSARPAARRGATSRR
ncbi:MAG TPA: hypothetical protein VHR67_03980 [Aestuariivirgaceae bacterium]|jgi:hypothetical protein|nr:hypothetical protein [Aestuariivirgaceae bacterium]